MINILSKLTIKDSADTDYSDRQYYFERDEDSINLGDSTDTLRIGYYKDIDTLYFNVSSAKATQYTPLLSYWDGTELQDLEIVYDGTEGFTRSGYIQWTRVESTLHSVDGYRYSLTFAEASESVSFKGIGLLLASPIDLDEKVPGINSDDYIIESSGTNHVKSISAATKDFIEDMKYSGYLKVDADGMYQDITAFDLLRSHEARQAVTYKTLSYIFENMSQEDEDKWEDKAKKAEKMYDKYKSDKKFSVDIDDDGQVDDEGNEISRPKHMRFYS